MFILFPHIEVLEVAYMRKWSRERNSPLNTVGHRNIMVDKSSLWLGWDLKQFAEAEHKIGHSFLLCYKLLLYRVCNGWLKELQLGPFGFFTLRKNMMF